MKTLPIAILAASWSLVCGAASFDSQFTDATLRADLVLAGKGGESPVADIYLSGLSSLPGWAGRRANLDRMPLQGNGQVTMTSLSGDTLYLTSFSSLFSEWITIGDTVPTAMQHSVLLPMPREKARVSVTLTDARRQPVATASFIADPADILIRPKGLATTAPHRYICRGRSANPIDVAIVGEGYTAEEVDSFYTHAAVAAEEILSYAPFRDHRDDFNFVAVLPYSADTGVSVPRTGHWVDTAFGSHFSTFYSDRYLTTPNVYAIHDALAGIPYEHIIILANTDEYGGGGIYNSYTLTAVRHKHFRPVVVHEFGHSFGGLADEYFYDDDVMSDTYPPDVEPWEPNITTLVDFPSKWKPQLPEGTPVPTPVSDAQQYPVGVYEGGGYSSKGVYRPADECRMRNNTWPVFCPVCTSSLESLIEFYTRSE